MIDGLELARMSAEAGEIATEENQQPFTPDAEMLTAAADGDWSGIDIPNFGDYRPDGWELTETYFVDSTGLDDSGPAMSIQGLINRMIPGRGYATIEEGQFQVYIAEFTRTVEKKT